MTGGTISECTSDSNGGAVYLNMGSSFTMSNGTIEKCMAISNHGGGIYVNAAEFQMTGGKISECRTSSSGHGGAVYLDSSTFTIANGTIDKCVSGNAGGGVYAGGTSKITMNSGTISRNSASWNGGGIFLDTASELVMDGGSIHECTAYQGGGIFAEDTTKFTMNDGTISNCKVIENGTKGGGIYLNGKDVTFVMNYGIISGNECEYLGGGIYTESNATIKAGQIINNKSLCETGYGGGIYVDKEATLYVYNVIIKDNRAASLGGGIWACRTGDVKIYTTNGGAIYDNTATGLTSGTYSDKGAGDDIAVYIKGGALGALLGDGYLNLSYHMLGGGANRYYIDGGVTDFVASAHNVHNHKEGAGLGAPDSSARYDEANAVLCTDTKIKTAVALKNVISDTAKKNAENEAQLIISGNSASRGAGIGTNGNLIIGTPGEDDDTGNLKVEKKVTGTHGDTDKAFEFTVQLDDTSINGTYGEMEFVAGAARFTLKHGESVTATGLPSGVEYIVEEIEANQDGYVTVSENDEGIILENDAVVVSFVNDKEETPDLPDKPDITDTGDYADINFYTHMVGISSMLMTFILVFKRRRKISKQ